MELKNFDRIYFVGIGGIGMSALASWFAKAGYQVAGYDRSASEITQKLQDEGIEVFFDESVHAIPDKFIVEPNHVLVVYTPAIPKNHAGWNYFVTHGYRVMKRAEALGILVSGKSGIAVSGTHGKTSVSTTTAWLLKDRCSAFLGGISKNLQSNVIIQPETKTVVIEADEYDRSFLTLFPETAVVTAMDADHLDIYANKEEIVETFYQFIGQIKKGGKLIYKKGLTIPSSVNPDITYYTYSLTDTTAQFYAQNIRVIDGQYLFDWVTPKGIFPGFIMGIPGLYNLENALAALAAAWLNGMNPKQLKNSLALYKGVKRRFDFQIRRPKLIYLDDYAHHPEEIRACVESVRHLFPNRHLTVVFQPHLYSRTRDFADEFAKSLDLCDAVILSEIYPAREEPIPGVTSQMLLDKMALKNKKACSYENILENLLTRDLDVLITMGAGNIDRLVEPITEALTLKYKEVFE
ncbi:MAG: UDP-N-acetylmuramate--L-alanine ligase [Salinivirgaceae bacterium]|nr:UDP-N-acetylmuramate--L-alanine ligase [Salinivirgaceae bacterium]